ncbi:hypothetical protein BKA81DRAFT_204757 [Phyllosticta paracitricarpa]
MPSSTTPVANANNATNKPNPNPNTDRVNRAAEDAKHDALTAVQLQREAKARLRPVQEGWTAMALPVRGKSTAPDPALARDLDHHHHHQQRQQHPQPRMRPCRPSPPAPAPDGRERHRLRIPAAGFDWCTSTVLVRDGRQVQATRRRCRSRKATEARAI